jgi:hypothetical protein
MPTTTPLNSWPVPVSTDLVKDGAEAIEDLGDAIDASVGSGLLAWQSWAPTLSGGWANGNGTWNAYYCQIGKTVHFYGQFTIGSTTTKGTNLLYSLPVTMNQNLPVSFGATSGPNAVLYSYGNTASTVVIGTINAASTYAIRNTITATVPVTWTTGNQITINGTYEAA